MFNKHTGRLALVATMSLAMAAAITAADALSQLGVSVDVARREVMTGIERGRVDYAVASAAFKTAPGPVRAQLAEGAIAWARTYTASTDFKTEYAQVRNARKPGPPDFDGTPEEERQRLLDFQTQEIEKSKAALASMDPETRREMEDAINQAAAAVRQLDTPEMQKTQLAGIRHARAAMTARYEDAIRRWAAAYPEDPSVAIARRLQAFLETSADVDYAAKLEARAGRLRFVDARLEEKSSEWKLCYRAGKEAVDAARHAAAAWLKDLESATPARPNEHP